MVGGSALAVGPGWVLMTPPSPLAAANTVQSAPTKQEKTQLFTVQVTGTVVNLRAGPGLDHAVLGQVRQGDELPITGSSRTGNGCILELGGESRWIYADLTDIDADVRWELAVVTALPLKIEGEFDNQLVHWEGAYRLEQWGSTVGAVFTTTRSPVPDFARTEPEVLLTVPEGLRPALNIEWEIEAWPVGVDGQPQESSSAARRLPCRCPRTARSATWSRHRGQAWDICGIRHVWRGRGLAPTPMFVNAISPSDGLWFPFSEWETRIPPRRVQASPGSIWPLSRTSRPPAVSRGPRGCGSPQCRGPGRTPRIKNCEDHKYGALAGSGSATRTATGDSACAIGFFCHGWPLFSPFRRSPAGRSVGVHPQTRGLTDRSSLG